MRGLADMSTDEALPAAWRGLERFAFGDAPQMADELLALVLDGTKTATCSALSEYEAEGERLPQPGGRSVVVDGRGAPACVIETCEVAIRRFDEVDAAFAHDEGEGDRSLAYWRREHKRFFRRHGLFSEAMLLVCERFRVVAILPR
jgi:uncharacterized protein YhfF